MIAKFRTQNAMGCGKGCKGLALLSALEKYLWIDASEHTTFYFAQRRKRDRDNFSAMLKSARDGIVDAGLLVDDSGLIQHPVTFKIDREHPRVEMEIRRLKEGGK